MADTAMFLSSAAASLSMLDSLMRMVQNARRENSRLTLAEVMAHLPVEAFLIAGQISEEITRLEERLEDQYIDINKTINELEADKEYWTKRQYRLIRKTYPISRALSRQIGSLFEDFIALAHCHGEEHLISLSFRDSAEKKVQISQIVNRNRTIREILRELYEESERLRAGLGDLSYGSGEIAGGQGQMSQRGEEEMFGETSA